MIITDIRALLNEINDLAAAALVLKANPIKDLDNYKLVCTFSLETESDTRL